LSDTLVKKLDNDQQLTLYRITQEQVNNILKHAMAKTVCISLNEEDEEAVLIISDDGMGFDITGKKQGIGLSNMKSRAELLNGRFFISSEPGLGCMLKVTLPLNAEK
jgi:signal transduction histidine kinase